MRAHRFFGRRSVTALRARHGKPCAVFDWSAREARTHWRFFWNTIAAMESREPALKGVDPVAVGKQTGTVLFDPKRRDHHAPANEVYPSPPCGPLDTEEQAAKIAQAWLNATMEHWSSIISARELPYGWAFTWTADEYIRTRDLSHALVGNGPLIVLRDSGAPYTLDTATPLEDQCAAFERDVLQRRTGG